MTVLLAYIAFDTVGLGLEKEFECNVYLFIYINIYNKILLSLSKMATFISFAAPIFNFLYQIDLLFFFDEIEPIFDIILH